MTCQYLALADRCFAFGIHDGLESNKARVYCCTSIYLYASHSAATSATAHHDAVRLELAQHIRPAFVCSGSLMIVKCNGHAAPARRR